MLKIPEKYRWCPFPDLSSRPGDPFGAFLVPGRDACGRILRIIASSGSPGLPWEHVSVSVEGHSRCPSWEEMCVVKDLFWDEDVCVVQYHPPRKDYVNCHPYTLHLWRPVEERLPQPPKACV